MNYRSIAGAVAVAAIIAGSASGLVALLGYGTYGSGPLVRASQQYQQALVEGIDGGALGVAAEYRAGTIAGLLAGAALTDANATVDPYGGGYAERQLSAATLSTNRVLTLTSGSPNGFCFRLVRRDRTAHTYAVQDSALVASDAGAGAILATLPASPTADSEWIFCSNGTHYSLQRWAFIKPLAQ